MNASEIKLRNKIKELADTWLYSVHDYAGEAYYILTSCANDLYDILENEENE